MTPRPSVGVRRRVIERAGDRCEYCLFPQALSSSTLQVDHIIAEKHGGRTDLDNLALSCTICNRRKGSDISSIDPSSGEIVALFNPRVQSWAEHFRLEGARIVGLSPVGRTTVELLQLNAFERLMERVELIRAGLFPMSST